MSEQEWLRTAIGASTPDTITIRGRDLANDLMGKVSFTELAFLLGAGLGKDVVLALIVGLLAAFVVAVFVIITRGYHARKDTIPFGPLLALGAIVALLAG